MSDLDKRLNAFRPDVADAKAARCAGKAAVGDEGDLAARSLAGQRRRGRKHFAHPRAATRSLIADNDDLAFLVSFLLDRIEGILFAIEAAGRT